MTQVHCRNQRDNGVRAGTLSFNLVSPSAPMHSVDSSHLCEFIFLGITPQSQISLEDTMQYGATRWATVQISTLSLTATFLSEPWFPPL